MGFLLQLLGGGFITKVFGAVLIGGIVITSGGYLLKSVQLSAANSKIEKLELETRRLTLDNTILRDNNGVLNSNLKIALDANAKTLDANRKLLAERQSANTAIAALAKAKEQSSMNADAAQKRISDMRTIPANNGRVAPVLRETIHEIQSRTKQ